MRYKEDWEQAKKRLTAFWDQEIIDRCCVSVRAFGTRNPLERIVPGTDEERFQYWTDPERVIRRNRAFMESTYYGGESFPAIFVDLGAGGHAGFFKGEKHYFGDSVWFFPYLGEEEVPVPDKAGFMYQKTLELARAYVEDSKGDYFVSMPDTTGNADALSHMMGSENLLPMMLEEPEIIERDLGIIETMYESIMRDVYDIVRDNNEGGCVVDWLSTWAPGFHAQMQSDMSVMISNNVFKRFVLPELQTQCRFLQYPLYHFDGVEQIRHLDDLLAIPELRAIQWTQVAGQKPCTEYFPEIRKIQAAGKSVIILVTPDQIKPIMENLSSKGLYLITATKTKEDADDIIKLVTRLTHD